MQMLFTSLGKSKKRKPNAKQRELDACWEALKKKYPAKTIASKQQSLSEVYSLGAPACRETPKIPSLPFTGDKIKGIGTMHKSNAVPVFSDQEAMEIATMRRN